MDNRALQVLVALPCALVGWQILKRATAKDPFAHISGPPSTSMLVGNFFELFSKDSWDYNFELAKKYGRVSHIHGVLNKPMLFVFDPKALYHILVKDQYVFDEPDDFIRINNAMFGPGLLATMGDHHRKQRKLLNPVFSVGHMKEMTPVFYNVVRKLENSIKQQITQGKTEVRRPDSMRTDFVALNKSIDILSWMTRTALELIGQSGFGYSFDSLKPDSTQHPFGVSLKNLFESLLARVFIWPWVVNIGSPSFQRAVVNALPWKGLHDVRDMIDVMHTTSVEIFEATKRSLEKGEDLSAKIGGGKDIMSILIKANMAASEEDKLPEKELLAQISTLTFAAMDTTSNALARIFDLLSQNQDVQDKVREEVTAAYEEHGGILDYETLTSLSWLDAVCRETLRLYPSVPTLFRQARKDTILPFAEPILTRDGKEISEVFVPARTPVTFSILSCNRDPKIWGADAAEWKPQRWLNPLPDSVANARVPGVYSHLMTFIGGGRACIGFKFSQLEMKVILSVLLQSFKFEPNGKKVIWQMNGIVQPTTEDAELGADGEQKLQLPLKVSLVKAIQ
ncbi:cytochrome P450 [Ephemerocybe angulata]|uniref:Cytochrome P450 n=1 Tax=Ephemerocybe angulata TaxID=980116 RepID=A0A8H6HKP5_9AGAR|nr:cytochrome P450 [Tulosesus angulatus]